MKDLCFTGDLQMKYLKIYFLFMWTMCFIIAVYTSNIKTINLPAIITFSIPYLIILWKSKKNKSAAVLSDNKQIDNRTKSEPTGPQYIENDNVIYRTDGKKITDAEIPYLMQLGYEKASTNPKFHRTEREDELSYQFECTHGNKACQLEEKFEDLYVSALKTKDLLERISLLQEAVVAFEKAKKFCYSKGKGGTIYFQDMWEYMQNSQNDCFSYLDNIINALEQAKRKRDVIIPSVLNAISENDGVLQKNIYSLLPDISKSEIQSIIRDLEGNGSIQRTKKSGSYELHIKGN